MKSEHYMILLPAYQIWTVNSANDALLFVYFIIRQSNKEINHLTFFFTIDKNNLCTFRFQLFSITLLNLLNYFCHRRFLKKNQ
jgi:hypothetical protein